MTAAAPEGDILDQDDVDFTLERGDLLDRDAARLASETARLLRHLSMVKRLAVDPSTFLVDDGSCFARDAAGQRCDPASPAAAAWTWRGAVAVVAPNLSERTPLLDAIVAADPTMHGGRGTRPSTQAEVLAAIDRAIEAAQSS
jgi:hypothetical protein